MCTLLSVVLLQIALFTETTIAQAPSDSQDECQVGKFMKNYPDGSIVLLDTYNYDQLLGQPNPVWTSGDYDTNNNPSSFFLTSVSVIIIA